MNVLITISMIVVAIIHLIPLVGVVGANRLRALYAVELADENMTILMRHRAILFGLLGLFFLLSAFVSDYQPIAFVAGYISVISFLYLAQTSAGYNAAIRKIVIADIGALIFLLIASAAYFLA